MANWLASALLMRCYLNSTVSTSHHSTWWHRQRLCCTCSPFTTSSSKKTINHGSQVPAHWCFMRGHVSEKSDTNGWWLFAAAACSETARLQEIMTATFLQLMQWTRWSCQRDAAADRDSPYITSPYSLYTENYTRDTDYTAETLCKLKCKIKYRYQGTLKLNF